MRKRILSVIILIIAITAAAGCSQPEMYPVESEVDAFAAQTHVYDDIVLTQESPKSDVIDSVITDQKVMGLAIYGIGNAERLERLITALKEADVSATFFVTGTEAVQHPELLLMITDAGYEIGNATLTHQDLTGTDDKDKLNEIGKARELIYEKTGVYPQLLRVCGNNVDASVQAAAAACGQAYIIGFSMNPLNAGLKTQDEMADYVFKRKTRGGIIFFDVSEYDQLDQLIPLICKRLDQTEFKLVSVGDLIPLYEERQNNSYVLDDDWYNQPKQARCIISNPDIGPYVALTFDDWASDDTIDHIMDVLESYDVNATFFVRANGVELNPSLLYAMHNRGFEIGNHTHNHVDLTQLSKEEIKQEIIEAHEIITKAMETEPEKYIRPPFGYWSEDLVAAASECGYDIIVYNITAHDYIAEKPAEEIADEVIENAENGSIILLHILDGKNTANALPLIIEGLRDKGLDFVTVSQIIGDTPIETQEE